MCFGLDPWVVNLVRSHSTNNVLPYLQRFVIVHEIGLLDLLNKMFTPGPSQVLHKTSYEVIVHQ